MAVRRIRSSTRSTGHRAPTNWARSVATGYVTIAAGTKVLLATVILSNPGINETIRRTRGRFSVHSDQAVGGEPQLGALGWIVVNDLAIAAGAASIPGPVTDASDDGWFVWEAFASFGFNGTGGQLFDRSYQYDSKAMRRVQEGFTIALMVENANATTGFNISCGTSILTSLS